MGQNFSTEPVVEKETERDHNDIFNVAVSSCQGWRMSQEDSHTMMLELPGDHKAAFFAVYDGHGSDRVSKHASESLWRHIIENDSYIKGNFKEALEQAFLSFDREVDASYNAQLAGTTAISVLIVDNVIYCANIGDSRAVASVNCECVPLSDDHKPENSKELKRILAAGGYVLGNRVNGNLALSRAFGDFHYKGNQQLPPDQQIVSPFPDISRLELNDNLDFLILACDGIWDVLSSEEAVEFVISRLEQNMEPGLICEQLTTRCLAADYELVIGCDNMTVLLICYTRGRTWDEYCNDIFTKYRHGTTRVKTTRELSENDTNEFERLSAAACGSRSINTSDVISEDISSLQLEPERETKEDTDDAQNALNDEEKNSEQKCADTVERSENELCETTARNVSLTEDERMPKNEDEQILSENSPNSSSDKFQDENDQSNNDEIDDKLSNVCKIESNEVEEREDVYCEAHEDMDNNDSAKNEQNEKEQCSLKSEIDAIDEKDENRGEDAPTCEVEDPQEEEESR